MVMTFPCPRSGEAERLTACCVYRRLRCLRTVVAPLATMFSASAHERKATITGFKIMYSVYFARAAGYGVRDLVFQTRSLALSDEDCRCANEGVFVLPP